MTTGLAGCAPGAGQTRSPHERGKILTRLEGMLANVEGFRFHEDYRGAGPSSGYSAFEVRNRDQQLREHIRTFMIAGAAKELGSADAELERVVAPYREQVDGAVLGSLTRGQALAAEDDVEFLSALRDQPRLPLEVCAMFDSIAEVVGTPVVSRKRLERAASQLSWRLERQDPATVMSEYTRQTERMLARIGSPPEVQQPGAPSPAEAPVEAPAGEAEAPAPDAETPPGAPAPDAPPVQEIPAELLPDSHKPQPTSPTQAPPMADPPASETGPVVPSYTDAPPSLVAPEDPNFGLGATVATRPVSAFQGSWASVDVIGTEAPAVYYVKRIKHPKVVLFTTGGNRKVVDLGAIRWASEAQWTDKERARVERNRRGFGAMTGIGAALIIAGAITTPLVFAAGLGTIPLTPGIVLLVVGAVYLSRLKPIP